MGHNFFGMNFALKLGNNSTVNGNSRDGAVFDSTSTGRSFTMGGKKSLFSLWNILKIQKLPSSHTMGLVKNH
jgi:hypothetical protein